MVHRRLVTGFTVFARAWRFFLLLAWQIQSMFCCRISLRSTLSVCECVYSRRKHLLPLSCLSICVYERGCHWMDFCGIWYLRVVCQENPYLVKIKQKYQVLYVTL
jgi:hypothetical protein